MKKLATALLTLIFLLLIHACKNKNENTEVAIQETPVALQEEKSITSYTKERYDDLLDNLYQESVNKSPELKQLEADIQLIRSKPDELNTQFSNYNNMSENYYTCGRSAANTIKDSILRKRIEALIEHHKLKYSNKTAEFRALINQMEVKNSTLEDHHQVLKILITLPLIEQYQNQNKPDRKEFRKVLKAQEDIIQSIDKLTPKE